MKPVTFKFTVPAKAGLSFKTLEVRETTGEDEAKAKALAEASKSELGIEIIKASVVSLDGVKVDQPFVRYDKMTSKERNFIGMAWQKVNATPQDVQDDFLSSMTITV